MEPHATPAFAGVTISEYRRDQLPERVGAVADRFLLLGRQFPSPWLLVGNFKALRALVGQIPLPRCIGKLLGDCALLVELLVRFRSPVAGVVSLACRLKVGGPRSSTTLPQEFSARLASAAVHPASLLLLTNE